MTSRSRGDGGFSQNLYILLSRITTQKLFYQFLIKWNSLIYVKLFVFGAVNPFLKIKSYVGCEGGESKKYYISLTLGKRVKTSYYSPYIINEPKCYTYKDVKSWKIGPKWKTI